MKTWKIHQVRNEQILNFTDKKLKNRQLKNPPLGKIATNPSWKEINGTRGQLRLHLYHRAQTQVHRTPTLEKNYELIWNMVNHNLKERGFSGNWGKRLKQGPS